MQLVMLTFSHNIEVVKVGFLGLDNGCGTVNCLFLPAESL